MNKAELKAKADEYLKNLDDCRTKDLMKSTFIAGYEARNEEVKSLKEKVHWWKKEVNVAHRAREDEFENLVIENKVLKGNFDEAKEIIKTFLGLMQTFGYSPSINNFITKAEQFIKEK